MSENKLKRSALANLIVGYILTFCFLLLIIINKLPTGERAPIVVSEDIEVVPSTNLSVSHFNINRDIAPHDNSKVLIYSEDTTPVLDKPTNIASTSRLYNTPIYKDKFSDRQIYNEKIIDGDNHSIDILRGNNRRLHTLNDGLNAGHKNANRNLAHNDVDLGLLDRRLRDLNDFRESSDGVSYDLAVANDRLREDNFDTTKLNEGINLSQLTLAKDESELGSIDTDFNENSKDYGVGKGGELYAYNFPSAGVGAGIGSSAIGAGAAGGVGLSAGIGEGILNGETVPTLGGVGDGSKNIYGEPAQAAGVGGLVGGAGAGGAAGLTQGYVTEKLGVGMDPRAGIGLGSGSHNYAHLPKDGALHIMMHVDGSGSILNTRKQLEVMKDSILKDALLPYYNNDASLYDRRVTIVDNAGERTLRFFAEAAKKDNVLAVAFQDEAQPAYHLPNFNRKPEDHYLSDLGALKGKLGAHKGIYRGVLFQVDRGRTFAKSFKEFVGNAFQGTGYLSDHNLKKYHRDNNTHHIKNKDGIVFSEEYHAKDQGTPAYYLDLLFNASRRVGLDLNIYGAGLTDGKHNLK